MACWDIFKTDSLKERGEALKDVIDHWKKQSKLMSVTGKDPWYFKKTYNEMTKLEFDYDVNLPSMSSITKLKNKITWMNKMLGKKPGLISEWFKLPGNLLGYNPITKRYAQSLGIIGDRYRGNMEKHISNLDLMVKYFQDHVALTGLTQKHNITLKEATKKLNDMQLAFTKLRAESSSAATAYYNKNLHPDVLLKNGEMNALQSFHELIRDPSRLYSDINIRTSDGIKKSAKANYGANLIDAAHLWHKKMSPELFKLLSKGLDAYGETLKTTSIRFHGLEKIQERIENISKELVQRKDYVPTQALDIFPVLGRLTQDIYSGYASRNPDAVKRYANETFDLIENTLKLSGHVLPRGQKESLYLNKDVLGVIDKYVKNVVRFNYVAHASKEVTDATKKLSRLKDPELKDQTEFLINYLKQTHSDAIGLNMSKDSRWNLIARSLTSYQFLSKLGFNIRSAARNATQSLQNWVYFGGKAWRESRSFLKGEDLHNILQAEMKKHGVFFVDIEEMAGKHQFLPRTKVSEDGKSVIEVEPGTYEKVLRRFETSKFLKMAGKPMQLVENKVNRAVTFKIAFVQSYRSLKNSDGLVRRAVDRNPSKFTGDTADQKIRNEIIRKSSRFAAEAVKHLHYDYSIYAKPQIMRTPMGSILGQFSTYSINFFEYQRKIAVESGRSIAAGDFNSPEVFRAFRLASLYSVVNGILAPLFNTNIGSLLQNDTLDRIENMYWLWAADEGDHVKYDGIVDSRVSQTMQAIVELRKDVHRNIKPEHISEEAWDKRTADEIQKIIYRNEQKIGKKVDEFNKRVEGAYYGQGFVRSTFGGPTVSDLIKYGTLFSNMLLDGDEQEQLKKEYIAYGTSVNPELKKDEVNPWWEVARTINPQFARSASIYNTIISGEMGIPAAIGQETGLWGNFKMKFSLKDPSERKESIKSGIKTRVPGFVEPLFDMILPDAKEKKSKQKSIYSIGNVKYTRDELNEILNSIESL